MCLCENNKVEGKKRLRKGRRIGGKRKDNVMCVWCVREREISSCRSFITRFSIRAVWTVMSSRGWWPGFRFITLKQTETLCFCQLISPRGSWRRHLHMRTQRLCSSRNISRTKTAHPYKKLFYTNFLSRQFLVAINCHLVPLTDRWMSVTTKLSQEERRQSRLLIGSPEYNLLARWLTR